MDDIQFKTTALFMKPTQFYETDFMELVSSVYDPEVIQNILLFLVAGECDCL